MTQKSYVICATYGEYDDFTRIPMFVCHMQMEADLFVEALNNRERPCWNKVVDYFAKHFGVDYMIPDDIGFGWEEVDVMTLCEKHHNTF